jgi:hypothetical protein
MEQSMRYIISLLAIYPAGFLTIQILFYITFCDWGRCKKPSFLFSSDTSGGGIVRKKWKRKEERGKGRDEGGE